MFYKNFEPEKFLGNDDAEREIVTVMENNESHLKIASIKKNYEIEPHMAHTDVCIYLIEGELELNFKRSDDCSCSTCGCKLPGVEYNNDKSFKVKKGEMFMFEKHTVHSVKALKDSLFFIIKI